jgi:hypothetical protein
MRIDASIYFNFCDTWYCIAYLNIAGLFEATWPWWLGLALIAPLIIIGRKP